MQCFHMFCIGLAVFMAVGMLIMFLVMTHER
jgi:hypothetical protein